MGNAKGKERSRTRIWKLSAVAICILVFALSFYVLANQRTASVVPPITATLHNTAEGAEITVAAQYERETIGVRIWLDKNISSHPENARWLDVSLDDGRAFGSEYSYLNTTEGHADHVSNGDTIFIGNASDGSPNLVYAMQLIWMPDGLDSADHQRIGNLIRLHY